jgi:hypothetical protein
MEILWRDWGLEIGGCRLFTVSDWLLVIVCCLLANATGCLASHRGWAGEASLGKRGYQVAERWEVQ